MCVHKVRTPPPVVSGLVRTLTASSRLALHTILHFSSIHSILVRVLGPRLIGLFLRRVTMTKHPDSPDAVQSVDFSSQQSHKTCALGNQERSTAERPQQTLDGEVLNMFLSLAHTD